MHRRKRLPPARSTRPPRGSDLLPPIELREISRLGVVFRSHRNYEAGTSIALGIHLCESPADLSPHFLDLEGTVVDCRMVDSPGHELCYQVTLLFDGLTEAQSRALNEAAISASVTPHESWGTWLAEDSGEFGESPAPFGLN